MNFDHDPQTAARKERREAILLTLGSAAFVAAGAFLWSIGSPGIGLVGIVFFGACMLAGIMQLTKSKPARAWLGVSAALILGVGCGLLMLHGLSDGFQESARRPREVAIVVGGVGLVFFGGGGLLLLFRVLRGHRF